MTVSDERRPLLDAGPEPQNDLEHGERGRRCDDAEEALTWREWMAEKLEAPSTHKIIIFLIAIDACCVLADLTYTFLSPDRDCANLTSFTSSSSPSTTSPVYTSTLGTFGLQVNHASAEEDDPIWLTILAHISLAITTLFLLEIPLALWCFGPAFYNPFPSLKSSSISRGEGEGYPYASLHLFDAIVVVTTFVLEVVLRGREAELAGLLILLRLWRLVKLVGGLAVGAGELQEELSNKLEETEKLLEQERVRTRELEEENATLRIRVVGSSTSVSGPVRVPGGEDDS